MDTQPITRYASEEYIRKNNLDADSRVYVPENIRKMFMNCPEFIEPLQLDFESTIVYTKKDGHEIQTRPITEAEYEKLDPSQKIPAKKINYPSLILCVIFDIIAIVMFIIKFSEIPKEALPMTVIILLLINFMEFAIIKKNKSLKLKPDSQIAEGNAVLLNKTVNSDRISYSVMVAFNDNETYAQSIRCSYHDYSMMSVGSKVYVKVKGSNVHAYAVK